jgi:hypothetical protein
VRLHCLSLFRWASPINEILKNLKNINAKLDMITGVTAKSQEQEASIETDEKTDTKALH